jgi:hypothetical protein
MKKDDIVIGETLESAKGNYISLIVFGEKLDKKEGMGGVLKSFSFDNSMITMDLSNENSILMIKISGVESGYELGKKLNVFAGSVEVRWDFTPKDYREPGRLSVWKLEKVGSSENGDIIQSIMFTAWDNATERMEFVTQEPAVRLELL